MSEKYYFFILVFCFYCQLFQSSTMASPVDSDEPKIPDESEYDWENFKKKYGRHYGPEEEALRHEIFNKNVEKIKEHNKLYAAKKTTYIQGVNDFTDKKPEELKYLTGLKLPEKN
ncbi:cathepsin Q-like isoform X2 [Lycorma delicatula]|uniref:cathepsin Q-like isoform X2 n=1 Tax=Lycorma delicatula TaxID=130591 RepID=UPI003F514ED3